MVTIVKTMDSILDRLEDGRTMIIDSDDSEEIIVPKLCAFCKNNAICSVLPTLINLSRIGIMVGVDTCPFHSQKK